MPFAKRQKVAAVPVVVHKPTYKRKKMKRCLPEKKYVDISSANYSCDTTGTVTAINLAATGDDDQSRDGRVVENLSAHVQGCIVPTDATSGATLARILLVWDYQPNGALAGITDILLTANSVSGTNLNNRKRFRILRDTRVVLGQVSSVATQSYAHSPGAHVYNEFVHINKETMYSGTTAAIGSVVSGALLLVTVGNQATAAAAIAQLTTRVRFVDH